MTLILYILNDALVHSTIYCLLALREYHVAYLKTLSQINKQNMNVKHTILNPWRGPVCFVHNFFQQNSSSERMSSKIISDPWWQFQNSFEPSHLCTFWDRIECLIRYKQCKRISVILWDFHSEWKTQISFYQYRRFQVCISSKHFD